MVRIDHLRYRTYLLRGGPYDGCRFTCNTLDVPYEMLIYEEAEDENGVRYELENGIFQWDAEWDEEV